MTDQRAFAVQMMAAIRQVAEGNDQRVERDAAAVAAVVDAVARAALAVAVGADPKVTGVLAHINPYLDTVVVSVRRKRNDQSDKGEWQELVP